MVNWAIENYYKTSFVNSNFLSENVKKMLIALAVHNNKSFTANVNFDEFSDVEDDAESVGQ
jgi:hypothetical protein